MTTDGKQSLINSVYQVTSLSQEMETYLCIGTVSVSYLVKVCHPQWRSDKVPWSQGKPPSNSQTGDRRRHDLMSEFRILSTRFGTAVTHSRCLSCPGPSTSFSACVRCVEYLVQTAVRHHDHEQVVEGLGLQLVFYLVILLVGEVKMCINYSFDFGSCTTGLT